VIADVNMKGGIEGDHLTFSQAQFANFDALMARTFQEGTDTVIRMPNAVIKLTGVSISDITIDDFSFLYAV
jgi:hypothetical protein